MKHRCSIARKTVDQFAIAVDEHHQRRVRPLFVKPRKAGVSRPCGGVRRIALKFDNRDAKLSSIRDAAVLGAGINIDDALAVTMQRIETPFKTIAFIAADRDEADMIKRHIQRKIP